MALSAKSSPTSLSDGVSDRAAGWSPAQRRAVGTYREFENQFSLKRRMRSSLRNVSIRGLSVFRSVSRSSGWIRFPYYHHVFEDERAGFERQIDFMKDYGSFISFDVATTLLKSGGNFAERYFCLSFDDGFRNCITNALPILASKQVPCMFFIATEYIGTCLGNLPNPFGYSVPIEFLTWDDCRKMASAGMQIGSHTCSHRSLKGLRTVDARQELQWSKHRIESELRRSCNHFSAPRGIPDIDFIEKRDPSIAKDLGYHSFSTARRGAMRQGASPYLLLRDHMLARWGNYQLRYFFSS